MSKVYFISAPSLGVVKIGYSSDPHKRLHQIQVGSAVAVEIVAAIDGDMSVEMSLHERFSHLRSHGEWYSNQRELLQYIESLPPWLPPEPMKRGRPATGRMRPRVLQVRISDAEHASLERQAMSAKMSLHAYVRSRLGMKD